MDINNDMNRLRVLGAELNEDPLAQAVKELQTYQLALREARKVIADAGLTVAAPRQGPFYVGPEVSD